MLPTKGYFQDIQCPFYNTTCGRPYCHFRHKRKPNENVEENIQETSKNVVPTYKPTPKSELANIHNNKSHIPISYVPDLSFKRERTVRPVRIDKPTYKPTPLSILSSATKPTSSLPENHEHQETIKDIQENIASNVYDPLKSEFNFEDLSNEFEQIDDIINDSEEPPQPSINDNLIKLENDIEQEQNRLNLLQSEIESNEDTDISTSKVVIKTEVCSDEEDLSNVTIKAEFSADEAEVKEEPFEQVVVKKEILDIKKEKPDENSSSKDKNNKKESRDHKDKKESKSSQKDKPKNSDKTKNKDRSSSKEKSSKEKDPKKSERSSKSHKSSSEREKHRKEEKKNSSGDHESSKDKHKTKTKSKDRSKSPKEKKNDKKHSKTKSESNSDSEYNSSDRSPDRHRKEKKSDSSKTKKHKSREKSRSRSKKRDKKSKSSKSRSRSRSTSKEKSSKSKQKSKKRSESRTRHKNRDSKNSKSRDDKEKNRSKNKYKEKEKTKPSSNSKKSEADKKDKRKQATSESNYSTSDNDNDVIMIPQDNFIDTVDLVPSDVDLDLDDEDETMRECYRIFNEYKPEPIKRLPPRVEEVEKKDLFEEDINVYHGKKRTAHAGAENLPAPPKLPSAAPPKPIMLPGQILTNRYRIAKMTQASNEQENIMNEVKNITQQSVKRPATSLLEAARQHKMKRLLQQQQKLAEKDKPNVNIVDDILNGVHRPTATQVKALPKKIAAVPNVALIEKAKQRISLVKQQRIDNVKTIAHTQKKGRQAHVPEYSLSDIPDVLQADKSKLPVNVRTRFLTMIADECAKLYVSKEDAYNRALNEEFSCYEKCKVLATYRNSAMLAVNRLRKEIQDRESKGLGLVLTGETPVNKKETDFEGKTFYDHVKKWILSEEELDVHGYPRETDARGKAIINNREPIDYSIVDENHRKCSRCGKIYQVDDDGWPLFDEECMYHPLKKRTIRGEQIFLCCKSNDDTGCAASDTHVFDGLPKHLLEGYQTTLPPESDDDVRSIQVYALDCEMCYTTKGLELTRVTVVDTACKTVYESFVKPLNPIIDYNTRFSGITKDQMDRTSTSILQVQANILHLCNSETILVGHSLESDMKALKIVHGTIIDTSVLFPHKMGLPHKRALRALASEYLKKIIQNDVAGHDSAEDAVACMDLIKWKLKEELKVKTK